MCIHFFQHFQCNKHVSSDSQTKLPAEVGPVFGLCCWLALNGFCFFFWDKSGPKILRNTRLNSTRRLISASVVHFANSCWPSLPIEQNFLLARYAGAKWCNSTVAKRMSLIVTEWVFELPSLLIAHQKCNISVYSTPPYYIWVVCNA